MAHVCTRGSGHGVSATCSPWGGGEVADKGEAGGWLMLAACVARYLGVFMCPHAHGLTKHNISYSSSFAMYLHKPHVFVCVTLEPSQLRVDGVRARVGHDLG